jgi:hypothetical protein
LLIIALALQVPWVSSPLFAYKFTAGFQVCAALMGGHPVGGFRLGSDFQINFFQPLPWGIGVNFVALALLILLVRATWKSNTSPAPTTVGAVSSAARPTTDASGGPVLGN